MKIGITERGDAGLNFAWRDKLPSVNGAVLITKCLNDDFIEAVLEESKTCPLIVHATCTGWGGTVVEPNVPVYTDQLKQLQKLIDEGFPKEKCVLCIDPKTDWNEYVKSLYTKRSGTYLAEGQECANGATTGDYRRASKKRRR